MYDLRLYHPAEEPKVKKYIDKELTEFETDKDVFDANELLILKNSINDCIKAYSQEHGVDLYEIDESWYERHTGTSEIQNYPKGNFTGYYIANCFYDDAKFVINPPYKNPIMVPPNKTVSIYTAPDERFVCEAGRLLIVPAHLDRYFMVNDNKQIDTFAFTTKKSV